MPKPKLAPQAETVQAGFRSPPPLLMSFPESQPLGERKELLSRTGSGYDFVMPDKNKNSGKDEPRIAAAGQVTKRRPPSKLPGYVPDSRIDTVGLTAHVSLELRTAVRQAAKMSGVTTQEYVVAVLTAAAAQQQPDQAPVKVNAVEAVQQFRDTRRRSLREAALRLAASLA